MVRATHAGGGKDPPQGGRAPEDGTYHHLAQEKMENVWRDGARRHVLLRVSMQARCAAALFCRIPIISVGIPKEQPKPGQGKGLVVAATLALDTPL